MKKERNSMSPHIIFLNPIKKEFENARSKFGALG
jgi:hypothetical protein